MLSIIGEPLMPVLNAAATFQFGDNVYSQRTGQTLAKFYSQVSALPFKLQ